MEVFRHLSIVFRGEAGSCLVDNSGDTHSFGQSDHLESRLVVFSVFYDAVKSDTGQEKSRENHGNGVAALLISRKSRKIFAASLD